MQRRPALLSVAALAVMLVLLIPALSIRLGSSDQGNDPAASTTRKAYDLLAQGFGPGFNGPLLVVGHTTDPASTQAPSTALAATLKTTPGVASVVSAPDRARLRRERPRRHPDDLTPVRRTPRI